MSALWRWQEGLGWSGAVLLALGLVTSGWTAGWLSWKLCGAAEVLRRWEAVREARSKDHMATRVGRSGGLQAPPMDARGGYDPKTNIYTNKQAE